MYRKGKAGESTSEYWKTIESAHDDLKSAHDDRKENESKNADDKPCCLVYSTEKRREIEK